MFHIGDPWRTQKQGHVTWTALQGFARETVLKVNKDKILKAIRRLDGGYVRFVELAHTLLIKESWPEAQDIRKAGMVTLFEHELFTTYDSERLDPITLTQMRSATRALLQKMGTEQVKESDFPPILAARMSAALKLKKPS